MALDAASQNRKREPHRRRVGGVIVPHQPVWHQRLAAAVVCAVVRSVTATIRFQYKDAHGIYEKPFGPAIYCVWHNRLAVCLSGYLAYARRRNPTAGMAAMVSASKDGAFLAAILEGFGVQPVRGSSSRRGAQALIELTTWAEKGYDLAITPDGPRGPKYAVQEGVTSLARVTGLPIILAGCNLKRKLRLNTWDNFQVPYPFTTCEVVVAEPVRIPRDISDEEREAVRTSLENTLRRINSD